MRDTFVIVATYEHALGLIHKWYESLGIGFNTTYGDHIKCLVMDEAHYATESDRTARRALVR
jgi:replicative superfamily II helicase